MSLGIPSNPRNFPLERFLRQVSYIILVKDDVNGVG